MWLPTNSFGSGIFRPCQLWRKEQAAFACIRALFFLCFAFFSGLMFSACAGYQLGTESLSVLGDGSKTLKIKDVDYPTLQPWLPYAIRSRLRDEVNARYLAKWVDSGSSDYTIQINVLSFTSRQWIRSELDTSLLYDNALTIEAVIYDGSSNKELWRSGKISYSEQLEKTDNHAIATDLVTQVIRMLADKLRNTF